MICNRQTLFQTPTVVYLSNLFLTCLTQIESEINFKMVRHRIGWLTGELLSASRWVADKYSDETFVCFLTIELLSWDSSAAIIVHSIRNRISHKYRFFFIRHTYHLFNILCFNPVRIFNFYARMIFRV